MVTSGFWVFLFALHLWATPPPPRCSHLFSKYQITENYPHWDLSSREKFSYEDSSNNFYFNAELNDGVVSMDIRLRSTNGLVRSAQSGKDLYRKMIRHFGVRKIVAIQARWFSEDNYQEFSKNLKQGLSLEEAALQTWSGRQATLYGFSYVNSVAFRHAKDAKNPKVQIRWVEVFFERPPKKSSSKQEDWRDFLD